MGINRHVWQKKWELINIIIKKKCEWINIFVKTINISDKSWNSSTYLTKKAGIHQHIWQKKLEFINIFDKKAEINQHIWQKSWNSSTSVFDKQVGIHRHIWQISWYGHSLTFQQEDKKRERRNSRPNFQQFRTSNSVDLRFLWSSDPILFVLTTRLEGGKCDPSERRNPTECLWN